MPTSQALLEQAAERGENLGATTAALLRLVDRYGAAEVETAVRTALARGGYRIPMWCVWPWKHKGKLATSHRQ